MSPQPESVQSPFVADGLTLGARVAFGSAIFNQYHCGSSDQYPGLTRCDWNRSEGSGRQKTQLSNSILHSSDGTAYYINKYIQPASFRPGEVGREIERLSQKFRQQPNHVMRMPHRNGLPDALIVSWGKLNLTPLDPASMSALAAGKSPGKGVLVDYLGHFTRSARENLPVYSISGEAGFVWAASYDQKGHGTLRFFAMDPSKLQGPVAEPPSGSPPPTAEAQAGNPDECFHVPSSDPQKVIRDCTPVITASKTKTAYERALNRRGLAFFRLRKNEEALKDFDALIATDKTAGYLDNRRNVLAAMGQFDKALTDANEAVRLAPTLAFAYQGRGDVYFEMAKYELAITDYTTAYNSKDHFIASIFTRGRAYAKLGQLDKAIQDFTTVLDQDQSFSAALRERGVANADLGMLEKAEVDLTAFLQREPSDADAQKILDDAKSRLAAGAGATTGETSDASQPKAESPLGRMPVQTQKIKEAATFLDDASRFIAAQSDVAGIQEIAGKAAELKIAIAKGDEESAVQAQKSLALLLNKISGYDDFVKERAATRAQADARRLADAKTEASKNIHFIDSYIAKHLGAQETEDLLRFRRHLNGALSGGAADDISAANSELQNYVRDKSWNDLYSKYVENFGSPKEPPAPARAKTLDEELGIGPESQFLTHGPADEIIILYNDSPDAPSIAKNVRGDFVFRKDTATLCSAQPNPDPLMSRFIEDGVRKQGAKQVSTDHAACNVSSASSTVDFIFFTRDWLLKQQHEYIIRVRQLLDANKFKLYKIVSNDEYGSELRAREQKSRDIEAQVNTGAARGYGVVILSDPPPAVCVITPAEPEQSDGVRRLLSSNRAAIAPALENEWQFVDEASVDDAFFDLRRRQCGYAVGTSAALKDLIGGLRRERLEYRFAPIWFDDKEVGQATFDARDEHEQAIRKEQERRRRVQEQQELEKQRRLDKQQEKTQREGQLREKNGVRARALRDEIDAAIKRLSSQAKADRSAMSSENQDQKEYPTVFRWLTARNEDHWETFDISSEIADYGSVQWHGRTMDGIIVRATIQQKNRILGEYDKACFLLGFIADQEFSMERQIINERCEDGGAVIRNWKIGNSFKSQWNAD